MTHGLSLARTLFQGMKTAGKQDEAWVVNRLVKQLTDMGFPVTTLSCFATPPCIPPRVALLCPVPACDVWQG